MADKLPGSNHGPHGVGAGWPDADFEQVENADGHGVCEGARGPGAKWGQQKSTPWVPWMDGFEGRAVRAGRQARNP